MKLPIIFFVIVTILSTGDCTICYRCVDGDRSHVSSDIPSCNRFLDNNKCHTTQYSDSCVTYFSDYLHERTMVRDCLRQENPIKSGPFRVELCSSDYCNRNENWGHYNTASTVTLQTSLGLISILSIYFL